MYRLSELAAMGPVQRNAALRSLTSKPNGGRQFVESEIRALEQRYEMSSAAMLASGIDTADTARWRVLLRASAQR
jgi:hypothetical protein